MKPSHCDEEGLIFHMAFIFFTLMTLCVYYLLLCISAHINSEQFKSKKDSIKILLYHASALLCLYCAATAVYFTSSVIKK